MKAACICISRACHTLESRELTARIVEIKDTLGTLLLAGK